MTTAPPTITRYDAGYLARSVTLPQLFRALGVRVRTSKRADCPLCKGNSTGTLAFRGRLWHCHRCNEGGNVFSLVRAVNGCNFPEALRFVAELAGIRFEGRAGTWYHGESGAMKRERDRLEDGADKLSALEHALLLEIRARIHEAERTRLKISDRLAGVARGGTERFRGEQEGLWLKLQAAAVLLDWDLPAYTLIAFGAIDDRARFVLHPELRGKIIAAVRWAGYVRTPDGRQMDVLQ